MAGYIKVAETESDEPMEIPVEEDGTLLLTTLSAQFPGSCGLRFRNPESGIFRGVRVQEGRLYFPESENSSNIPYIAVYPKVVADGDNKRKVEENFDDPNPKTKKLENIKTSDLIVLGLDYNTNEETMKNYFSQFGTLVLCEIKKNFETGKSRGYGFVKYTDYSAQRSVLQLRHEVDGRMCDVKIPASKETDKQRRRVFIGHVPETMVAEDLRDYFKQYGTINEVFIPKPYRPFAFITFEDPEVAESLCGEEHLVKDTTVLVRSAAPRQSDRPNREKKLGITGQVNKYASGGMGTSYDPSSTPNNTNLLQTNPQAFFAAALSQAAHQAAQAVQSQQGNWGLGQQQQTHMPQSMSGYMQNVSNDWSSSTVKPEASWENRLRDNSWH